MPIRKSLTFAATLLMAGLTWSEQALSCSCLRPPATPADVMRAVPLLFWGRAVAIQEDGNARVYTVEVWGGNAALPITVAVRTERHSAACGIELPLNQVELIAGSPKDGSILAGLCTKHWVDAHKQAIGEILKTCQPFAPCPPP